MLPGFIISTHNTLDMPVVLGALTKIFDPQKVLHSAELELGD